MIGYKLNIEPAFDKQKMETEKCTDIFYWEGSIRIRGRNNNKRVTGHGYLELIGCAGNGLRSLFANSPKDSRKFFYLDGNEMVGLDLQCSQAIILAHLLKNEALLENCFNNSLYQSIMNEIDVDRDETKELFYWVLYSPNDLRWGKKPRERKAKAKQVQNLIAKTFPITSTHMIDKKDREEFRDFLVQMQDTEAGIFANEIYNILMRKYIPSLLIHDSIYVPNHWVKVTE